MGAAKTDGAIGSNGDTRRRGIDHVQLAIPMGAEDVARTFWVGRLGFREVPKPAAMAARGGAWFEAGDVVVHVGADVAFVPARTAYPALLVAGLRALVDAPGLDAIWNDEIPGVLRCHVDDPFDELIEVGA